MNPLTPEHKALVGKRQLWYVPNFGAYNDEDGRVPGDLVHAANAVSSAVDDGKYHRPILDLDRPYTAADALQIDYLFGNYAPTPGHCHLYLQFNVPAWQYMEKLLFCAVFGLIETSYAVASIRRGATFLRLPGVMKES